MSVPGAPLPGEGSHRSANFELRRATGAYFPYNHKGPSSAGHTLIKIRSPSVRPVTSDGLVTGRATCWASLGFNSSGADGLNVKDPFRDLVILDFAKRRV